MAQQSQNENRGWTRIAKKFFGFGAGSSPSPPDHQQFEGNEFQNQAPQMNQPGQPMGYANQAPTPGYQPFPGQPQQQQGAWGQQGGYPQQNNNYQQQANNYPQPPPKQKKKGLVGTLKGLFS